AGRRGRVRWRQAGSTAGWIVAGNWQAGRRLAEACGFRWQAELGSARPPLLVNVTPLGMQGAQADELSFDLQAIDAAETVFEVVATPADTPLIQAARRLGTRVVSGAEVAAIQALEPFVLYPGRRPTDEQQQQAAAFARPG
ncbi:shikimate 5-dehydrogenase, partial [Pseudomonas syringae]